MSEERIIHVGAVSVYRVFTPLHQPIAIGIEEENGPQVWAQLSPVQARALAEVLLDLGKKTEGQGL